MSLTADEIRWVAHLARLELSQGEVDSLTRDLNAIVDYVQELQQLPTDNVEPLAHPIEVANVFRDDEPRLSLPLDQALANAPERRDEFFSVPAVRD